eukprot:CAMPEP_0116128558 /NCGR_PEP_ID=MMETSP0329-20121206/7422_1 /TAXON_ID=697910 /ORGANISM="Pseudo-nitzschia arenysensis, Strain B593" /LENGTH=1227 /DNA_ID=CAMNT_0003622701 /DNA_START=1204 /DNA_END=4887 /DNA_ORIENTATION=-
MNAASTGGEKKNVLDHQASPTSVTALSIDVNSPHDHQSSADINSKRNRRRRKGKGRGKKVEPMSPSAPSPRSRNHHNNNSNKKKKNGSNSPYNNNNGNHNHNRNGYGNNESGQRSSSFRTPIVTWRNSRGSRNSNNRYNNNSNNGKNWTHSSSRFGKLANSPVCPASTGYPTSKKQHDAPMKRGDLYFALHVERVGIASHPPKEGSPQDQEHHEQKAVARVTLTNWDNEFVLDTFVAIPVPVTDFYDTGIQPENVEAKGTSTDADESHEATETTDGSVSSFAAIRSKVERILRGKILIGYELEEGLQALGLNHPSTDIRDCSVYFYQNSAANESAGDNNSKTSLVSSLEELSQKELSRSFLSAKPKIVKDSPNKNDVMILGKDSSISRKPVQICVTTMDLYKKCRKEWETALIAKGRERDRQQQDYLMKISQQRQQEQQQVHQHRVQQQQYRPGVITASLHCEMVRTAISGRSKSAARVTIVDGPSRNVLLDEFVQIPVPVTDFCETGINERDVMVGNEVDVNDPASHNAMPLSILRGHVERILHGRVLIGYKIEESLKALGLSHPWANVRDIAYFPPFLHNKLVGGSTSVVAVRSLDELSEDFLRQRVRPMGNRSRPVDLCQCSLGLYECFRDQWERQPQQQDVFLHRQQQVHHAHHVRGQMIPPSPTSMMQSPHLRPNHYYGQKPAIPPYNPPMMMTPSPQQQLQRQVLVPEQQQHYAEPRTNPTSSSWFSWSKQQTSLQTNVVGASQTLSTQALQVLQEDFSEQGSLSPKNHFLPVCSHSEASALAERTSSYDGSIYGGGSEFSEGTSDFFTESVVSSLRDESSSVISGEQSSTIPSERKGESSSWFRFGSKKSKDQTRNEATSTCETMAAVQETEVLNDAGMLPLPVELFPPIQDVDGDARDFETDERNDENKSDSSSGSPQVPRSWFAFRKSPVPRDRSRSPSSSFSHSTIEDLSVAAQAEGVGDAATEASIEITLSIPASVESEDTIASLIEKSATTSLTSRPSSSWFGRLRSSKSSGSKSISFSKESTQSKILGHPDLKMAPTECTTAMDEDWLQEIMSQSTDAGTDQELEAWMNGPRQDKSAETSEKQLAASRGQASWFGFKRSKALGSSKMPRLASLDTTKENFKAEAASEVGTWSEGSTTGSYWLPEEADALAPSNIERSDSNDVNDIFHSRARLPTESTIPSIATDEPSEEEHSESGSYSNDLDFGAAQSFNFLKI